MGLTIQPPSSSGGIIFGSPTTFNAAGTYTIPATASTNSVIMIESIGGGGAGGRQTNITFIDQSTSGNESGSAGGPGAVFIGTYRLGFLFSSPAGQTATISIGAGGTGASYASQSLTGTNENKTVNGNTGNAGGSTSVSLAGTTTAIAAGGTYATGTNAVSSATSSFYSGIDSTQLTNLGPRAGGGGFVSATSGINGTFKNVLPTDGKLDFGATASGGGTNSNNVYVTQNTTPLTPTAANDATAGSGAGGGSGGYYSWAITGTSNHSKGGAGAQPGGGGGGITGYGSNNGRTITWATNNASGAGGSGRVRIWYSA